LGYLVKAILGVGLFVGGVILFNVKLLALLETGTCASGNTPYQIAKPCPSGTGTDIMLLMASLLGAGVGALLFANRGTSPRAGSRPLDLQGDFTYGPVAWGLFFTSTGATSLVASLTDEAIKNSSGAQLGGIIVGATFLVMGLPALVLSVKWLAGTLHGRDRRSAPTISPPPASIGGAWTRLGATPRMSSGVRWTSSGAAGAGDQINRLERLQRLRESGALTDSEFEREKARILSEG
jgi:putative oligomerization/nucleic acid binding protein